jgi:anti-sigma-K factor RskA
MTPDIHTLTGAYAADALSADERRFFEAHLAECDACAQEVAELQATAAMLGAASFEPPPPSLRDAVLAEIDQVRQEPPAVPATGAPADEAAPRGAMARAMRRWTTDLALPAAAVVVIAVLGLSAVVANLTSRLGEVETQATQLTDVLAAADAQLVTAEGPGGSQARVVVSASRGEAVFVASGMDPAPHEHTYELWLIDDSGATPAGLFDVDERGRATRVMTGDLGSTLAIGVTVEPEGGSPQPTTDPVMVVDLAG